jgi:Rad3-related DNA helicase
MFSLFINAKEKSLLIGIIDTWIDEGDLWQWVDTVILAKVPFDPPTDPYFLARTVGMTNNFEDYSSPIAINTINTLTGRIHSTNPKTSVICTDMRLTTMNWGKSMKEHLL